MRKFSLVACGSLLMGSLLMSSGPTSAADCAKGMLWPFVRAAGDCLTDAEIAAGQKGTYSGPTNTNVDVSAIKPADVPAQTGSTGSIGSTGNSNGALIDTSIFGAEPPARSVAQCHKGILWPFNREPGDCLTEGEKREGQTGVFGGAAAATQASVISTVPASGTPSQGSQPASVPQAVSCSKGWFWPFVKESGDCLSAGDKQAGQTGASGGAAVTQPSATTTVPVSADTPQISQPAPAPQAASCSKSLFWPFVKVSGDCLSDADKTAGQNGVRGGATVTQASATATATMPASAAMPQVSQPAPAPQPTATPQTASCSKGLFWPFVKESGDCPSDADKGK